jgi:hypothetical protein
MNKKNTLKDLKKAHCSIAESISIIENILHLDHQKNMNKKHNNLEYVDTLFIQSLESTIAVLYKPKNNLKDLIELLDNKPVKIY